MVLQHSDAVKTTSSLKTDRRVHPRRVAKMRGRRRLLRRRTDVSAYTRGAQSRLKRFRQGSRLAIAVTALLLLTWGVADSSGQVDATPAANSSDPSVAVNEATGTLWELLGSFYTLLPKIAIAVGIILFAILFAKALKFVLTRTLGSWSRAAAIGAISQVIIVLVALGAGLSVIAGDPRALVGSVGLAGLALSWALQTPIESFTGWLLNSFKSYYGIGDRIEVGEVFGDVYRIDILTTTVWEAGGANKSVQGAQPTGALITFPNSEVLRANIINYTRDFPYVWDEVVQGVANESDLPYSVSVMKDIAQRVLGDVMREPAIQYRQMIRDRRLCYDVASEPTVYVSATDSWINLTIRYLVPAREKRRWASELLIEISRELALPRHAGRIIPSLPATRIHLTQDRQGKFSAA